MNGPDLSKLSAQEELILGLAASGMLDKEISTSVGISINTIRTYWGRIRAKAGNHSRSALAVAYAANRVDTSSANASGEFEADWYIDFSLNRVFFTSDRPHPLRYQHGITVEESLAIYEEPERNRVKQFIEDARHGLLDTFFFLGQFNTPEGPQEARALCKVIRNEAGKPIRLCGRRMILLDTGR